MQTVEQLIEAAEAAQSRALPEYAKKLIGDLAHRLALEARAAEGARRTAEREVSEARALLTSGPEDSDTYLDLPRALYATEDDEQRPLGKGANIEFRRPEETPGEGISVKWDEGGLRVSGLNHLAVVPIDQLTLKIETR